MMLPATSLYRVPTVRFDARLAYTNNTYAQAMRGYGNPEVTWAIEWNLDELAEAAGIDALELRRRNCNEAGETTPMGLKVTTCGLGECLERTAKRLDWTAKRGHGRARARGVGVASLMHVGGSGRIYRSDGGGVILRLDDFGNVYVSYGGVEMGQGLHAALTVTVADALGVRPERVFFNPTDTATCPWDVGTHASRGAFIGGNAAILAAGKAREKIFALAAAVFAGEASAPSRPIARGTPSDPGGARPDARCGRATSSCATAACSGRAGGEPGLRLDLGRVLRAAHFRGRSGRSSRPRPSTSRRASCPTGSRAWATCRPPTPTARRASRSRSTPTPGR